MPKKIIAGNWKMFKTNPEAVRLVKQLNQKLKKSPAKKSSVVIFPPFTALSKVSDELKGSKIETGAQNLFWEDEGAYTGEVSAKMIKSTGAKWVIVGHSERRQYFKEEEKVINRKIKIVLMNKLKVIFCVGETLEMREQNLTKDIVINQVEWGLKGLLSEHLKNLVIAYEPVWAIGTGRTATTEQAEEAHAFIRGLLQGLFDETTAAAIRILYGGSVKPDNVDGLMAQQDIDGTLVGGASLKAADFARIAKFRRGNN